MELVVPVMADFTYDLNPVDQIVADAMGEPGKRTFFLQARAGRQLVSLVLESRKLATWRPVCSS